MRRILVLVLGLALVAGMGWAETKFNSVAVTDVSATVTFTTPRAGVLICNEGANIVYFRLFNENDTSAAATTAYSRIASGACKTFSKAPSEPAYFKAVSLICGAGLTATATIDSE